MLAISQKSACSCRSNGFFTRFAGTQAEWARGHGANDPVDMMAVLAAAFALGLVAGSRTLLAPAALFLARGGVTGYVLAVAALAELGGDLLPKAPPRTAPVGLTGRLVSGAFTGWMLGTFRGVSPFAAAALGLLGAVIGTFGGKALRLTLIARVGAVPAALAEDAIAVALALISVTAVSPR